MSRFSSTFNEAFQRLGGPGAVTWWAFGVSTIDRLVTVSVQPANSAAPVSARIAATLLAQLAMFAPLVLLRFTLLKDPARPRPWVALAGFAFADVLRAVVVDQLLHHLGGLPLLPELRVFSGFLPTLIPLVVTAYVVNTLRERRRELTRLVEVRDHLERARAEAESAVEQQNEALVQRVRTVLEAEVAAISSQQPSVVVAQLQRTATDVVRPLSHELATSFADLEGPPPTRPPVRVGWRVLLGDAFFDRPLRPTLTTVLISGVWLSAIAVFAPARVAMISSLVSIPILLTVANVALRRLLPRVGAIGRIAMVGGACLTVGVLIALMIRTLAGSWPSADSIAVAAAFYVVVVSAGMAVVSGVLAVRATILGATAVAVEQLREQVLRTRQLKWFHQRALSRALHGPIQSAVTAAAIRLSDASKDHELSPDVVDGVRRDLMEVLDVVNAPASEVLSIDDSLERVVGMWAGVCDVTTSIDSAIKIRLADDAIIRACVVDVVTDAVSNAVRHGNARSVDISIRGTDRNVDVIVVDDGTSTSEVSAHGLGSALLNECSETWSLARTESGHVLSAVLPLSAR